MSGRDITRRSIGLGELPFFKEEEIAVVVVAK